MRKEFIIIHFIMLHSVSAKLINDYCILSNKLYFWRYNQFYNISQLHNHHQVNSVWQWSCDQNMLWNWLHLIVCMIVYSDHAWPTLAFWLFKHLACFPCDCENCINLVLLCFMHFSYVLSHPSRSLLKKQHSSVCNHEVTWELLNGFSLN